MSIINKCYFSFATQFISCIGLVLVTIFIELIVAISASARLILGSRFSIKIPGISP